MDVRRNTRLLPSARCLPLMMMMMLLMATTAGSESPPCREQACAAFRSIRFHRQLGCQPGDGGDLCCPRSFNCSSLLSLEKSRCHYRGKAYEPGAQIQQEIRSVCTPSCTCVADTEGTFGGEATFHCAHIDCPEHFASHVAHPGCVLQYEVDQCCSTGLKCGSGTDGRQDAVECVYNGRTYQEGEYLDVPDNDCLSCVCQAGFNGTLDGPWCRKFGCDYTLAHRPSELAKCAPVFWKTRTCCPISWHCPAATDALVRRSGPPAENDEHCTFGEHRLNVGDELRPAGSPCIKCKCDTPPFITCTQFDEPACDPQTK